MRLRGAIPHHRPLPVEGRPQPCPPLRLRIAPRLGSASSAYVLRPAQVSWLCRLPFAAARTPLRQMVRCVFALVRGRWWGLGSIAAGPGGCVRGAQGSAGGAGRSYGRHVPARSRAASRRRPRSDLGGSADAYHDPAPVDPPATASARSTASSARQTPVIAPSRACS